jgi:hypothetical protein
MTRSILAVIAAGIAVAVLSGTGCKQTGVGDPCVPEQEFQPTFQGFNEQEVNVESKSFQCQTRLCLVNHFRGRVSCPYGQKAGDPPAGAKLACAVPGSDPATSPITGNPQDTTNGKNVQAQCLDRTADKAVYCSCRCQNVDGRTDDGANYCTCPDGFHCSQLVTSIGAANEGLTGGYCVKDATDFNRANACGQSCDAALKNCGTTQL